MGRWSRKGAEEDRRKKTDERDKEPHFLKRLDTNLEEAGVSKDTGLAFDY